MDKETKRIYNIWISIKRRCLDNDYQEKFKSTYIGCSICDEWLIFDNFLIWYNKNYIDGFHLDKDILIKGNKVYSPDTCCFVPTQINSLFIKTNKNNELPQGINLTSNPNAIKKFQVSIKKFNKLKHFGAHETLEKAKAILKIEKENYIKEVAEIWKNKISLKVYEILISYKLEI